MKATYLVQTLGTTAVVGAFLASDLVAQLLEIHPGSETLWYLQLGLLRPLTALRTSGGVVGAMTEANILIVGVAVLISAWVACLLRQRVIVGLMANCSLMFVGSMAYQSLLASGQTASLNALV